jgi:hypothetical protein
MPSGNLPVSTELLGGGEVLNGDSIAIASRRGNYTAESIEKTSDSSKRERLPGNNCLHNKLKPRFYIPPTDNEKRPTELDRAIKKLESVYHAPKSKFVKRLNNTNPKKRKKRTDRLEAIISVSQTIVHYMEAWTFQVGRFSPAGNFINYGLKHIANIAGITVCRTKRALNDLIKAGYLKVTEQCDKLADGGYRGLEAIRQISTEFFKDLGINYKRLYRLREWKRKRTAKAIEKKAQKEAHQTFNKPILSAAKASVAQPYYDPILEAILTQEEREKSVKKLHEEALRRHALNPELSLTDIHRALMREALLE